jgi:hypothetical protein
MANTGNETAGRQGGPAPPFVASASDRSLGSFDPAHPALSLGGNGIHLVEDFLVLGEAARVALAPDLRAVDVHVKHAAGALDQLGLNVELLPDRVRQTGGGGKIVSFPAVLDGDVHTRLRLEWRMSNSDWNAGT